MATIDEQIQTLSSQLEHLGFICHLRRWQDFPGLFVTTPVRLAPEGFRYFERSAWVYFTSTGWMVRTILRYGGPQWAAHAGALEQVATLVAPVLSCRPDTLSVPWNKD